MSAYERELVAWNAMSWVRKFAGGISSWRVLFALFVVAMGASVFTYALMPQERTILLAIPVMVGYMALFFSTHAPGRPTRERVRMRWADPPPPAAVESSDEEERWPAGTRESAGWWRTRRGF